MDIRQLRKEEYKQAVALADGIFRERGHVSMGISFPHVFSDHMQLSFGAFDGNKLVSFIGLVPFKIHIGDAILDVFSIGAVCTHDSYRKQGISTKILSEIYSFINSAKASLLFVSGDRGLYRRNECYPFGAVSKYSLSEMNGSFNGIVREWKKSDLFQIDHIRRKTSVRYEATPWEWANLVASGGYASIFKMEQAVLVAEYNGVVGAYVVISLPTRDSDYQHGIVTDWGGNTEDVCGIFSELLKVRNIKRIEINVPFHDRLNEKLSGYLPEKMSNGGTIHIIDRSRLLIQLKPHLINIGLTGETEKHLEHELELMSPEARVNYLFNPASEKKKGLSIPLPSTTGLWYV